MKTEEVAALIFFFLIISNASYGVPIAFNVNNIIALIISIPLYLVEMIAASATSRNLPMFAISAFALYYLWNFVKAHVNLGGLGELLIILFFISYFIH